MYNALFVRGQSFSVKIFDRSRSGCQDRGPETIFMGLSGRPFLSPRVSPRLPVLYYAQILLSACVLSLPLSFSLSLYQFGRKQLPSNKAACKQNRHKLGTVV